MKLLLYSHYFAPSIGGVETIVLSLARGLSALRTSNGKSRFHVTLVTETSVGQFNDSPLPFHVIRQPGLGALRKLIREADIVHVAGPAFWPLVLTPRKKLVVEHHGFQVICPNGQLLIEPSGAPCPGHFMAGRHGECLRCNSVGGLIASLKLWLFTFLRRALCSNAAANITPTAWLGGLVQLPRIVTIPHGLATLPACGAPAPSGKPFVIVFQGRLVTAKGVRVLFQAAQTLQAEGRTFQLVVIGDGPERRALEELAATTGLTPCVRFTGKLPQPELEAELTLADVIVVPSLGGEVFGLVVAENMLRGLPVIASDLGAFVEVLGEAGLTFHTGDKEELARRIAELMDDAALAGRLAQAARRRALDLFDLEHMVDAHAELYGRLFS